MTVAPVTARLIQAGYAVLDLTEYLSQETVPEITDAFEKPAETNSFVAPDVTVVGRDDASLTVTTRLRVLSPTGGDNTFEIWRGYGTATALRMFAGAVAPNTVSFDEQERSFTFTAFGLAKRLAEIDATDLPAFRRTTNLDGWTVASSPDHIEVIVTKAGALSCPFYGGDVLALVAPATTDPVTGMPVQGNRDEITISQVVPLGSYQWSCSGNFSQTFTVGSTVELVTIYARGVSVRDVVATCFQTAIPGATVNYLTSTPGQVGDFFATPLPTTGLGGVPFSVVTVPSMTYPIAVTQAGAYALTAAPSAPWTYDTYTNTQPAVDWLSNGGSGTFQLYGDRWDRAVTGPITARVTTYTYFAYRYDKAPPNCVRYLYQIITPNVPDSSGYYQVDVLLREQTSPDGKSWSGYAAPTGWSDRSFGTNTDLRLYLNCGTKNSGLIPRSVGITYGTFAHALFFIEPTLSGATGSPVRFKMSSFDVLAGIEYVGLVLDVRGVPVMVDGATMVLFAIDTFEDPYSGDVNAPHLSGYTVGTPTTPTLFGSLAIPASVAWHTLGSNYVGGAQTLYMMGGSPTEGSYFLTISIPGTSAPVVATSMVTPPGAGVLASSLGLCQNFGGTPYAPRWTALVGNTPWWIAASSSEVIDYLDCDGLTLADVIAQCALLTDAVWYVDISDGTAQCWYRSRQISSGYPIDSVSGSLDDGGLLSLKTQACWYRTYRYVTVTNERDDTVAGSAGDSGFRNGTMALALTPRYAYPTSFCYAIARHVLAYLGRGLEFLDLTHEDDGRLFCVGRTFTMTRRGAVTTFQITEVQRPALAGTVRIQAVEL